MATEGKKKERKIKKEREEEEEALLSLKFENCVNNF